jgi:molecular chaperone GrpE (heat shock protein)
MKNNINKTERVIVDSFKSNIILKDKIETIENQFLIEKRAMLLDIIQIIDVFEKAEQLIIEREWDKAEQSEKSIKRLLTAKTKTLSILEKHGVSKILFNENMCNDENCKTVGAEPDSTKPNGYILSVEKTGYVYENKPLREAEVIIVKN